jgi:hypothetical protein
MPLADGTPLIASDGSLMLDTDGSVRLADGESDDCCCGGGDCPEGCEECGECCFSPTSKLRVTVEWLICEFTDAECSEVDFVNCYKTTAHVTEETDLSGWVGWENPFWRSYQAPFNSVEYLELESCAFVDPEDEGEGEYDLLLTYNCETGHWYILSCDLQGAAICSTWDNDDLTDLGVGDCDGLTMAEFVQVSGWGCVLVDEGGPLYQSRQVRVTIEVIDNDDCMGV